MPGSAVLGTNLVDSLVTDVIDGIRKDLHPDLGVRQFNMYVVTLTYGSGIVGEGSFVASELAIGVAGTDDPQPLVLPYAANLTAGFSLEPCGVDTNDMIKVKEVSMTFTEGELGSPAVETTCGIDKLIKLADAHGQGIPDSYWRHRVRPFNDRINDMGWVLHLVSTSTPDGL